MPNEVFISSGQIVQSATGRNLSPAPKIDCTSDRRCINTIKRINEWLKKEALIECQNTGNEHAELMITHIDLDNVSQSDTDMLNFVLFDAEFAKIPLIG